MMYLFSIIPEGFRELVIPQNETYASYDCLRWGGKSKADTWKAPNLVWLKDSFTSESDAIADFTGFGGGPIAVSEKAYQTLKDVFEGQVEFLPTIGPDSNENWRLLNVTNVVDIMDVSKSKYEIYPDGKIGACTHAYLNEPDSGNKIYRVKGKAILELIDEETKNIIESAGLSGVLIREYLNP